MLRFFKRLMGKELATDNVPFSEINAWVENKLKESQLSKELSDVLNEIARESTMLAISIKKIAHKVIENNEQKEAIDEYRDEYISKVQDFIKQIKIEKKDPDSILNYYETLSAALEQLNDSTKNQFSIMQKFFPDESSSIEEALQNINSSKSKLDKLIKQELGVKYVSDITKAIHTIRKKNKLLFDLKEQIEKEEIKKKEAENYKLVLETELDDLKTAEEFSKYDQLLSKQIKFEKEIEREQQNLSILFSPLLKLFAEYDKKELGSDRALARQYSSNPIESLHNDKSLWILALLQSLSAKLPELIEDEQKRIKTRQAIMALNENTLRDYLTKYSLLKEGVNQVRRQILVNNTNTKIGDINYKMKHVLEQLKITDENTKKYSEEISQLNAEKDLLILEKKLSLLGKVKII